MALKDIASLVGLTASTANNYLVILVRIGLAAADDKPGYYRLGPTALSLGVSAIQQIDGFEIVRREVTSLHDTAGRSAAVTTWTDDGPISLYKQDGDQRGAFEFRTGLIPMLTSAAGKIYAARLPPNLTRHLIEQEWGAVFRRQSRYRQIQGRCDTRAQAKRLHDDRTIRPERVRLYRSSSNGLERRCSLHSKSRWHPGIH